MNGVLTLAFGAITFIVAQQIVPIAITGSDSGSVVMQNLLSLTVAVGAVVIAFLHFSRRKRE